MIGEANAELKELEAKDDLTAEEVQRAEFLRNAVKQQNVEMLQLDRMKKWEEELQKYEEEHSELTESEWAQQQQRQGIQEAKTLQKGWLAILPGEAEETEGRLTLRKPGAPNTADKTGQLRNGNVPSKPGFLEEHGFQGKIYADCEMLYGKHPKYFKNQEHAYAVVKFVLNEPVEAGIVNGNPAFTRQDPVTGLLWRIELKQVMKHQVHVRSAHCLNFDQEKTGRSDTPDGARSDRSTASGNRTGVDRPVQVSDFLRYDTPDSEKVKSEKSKKTEKHDNIRRIMYQGFVRSVDEAVRELKLEGMSIELIETAAALPEHIRSKPGALRAEGAYDQETGTVYLVAENLTAGRVEKVLLHEAVGHKGLHQIFGKRYGSFLEQIANDYADGVAAVAARRGFDLMDPAQRIEAADEFLAEMAETRGGEDVSVWKRIVAAVRRFFRRMGFHATWTDDEIADLFRQSRKTLKRNRAAKGEAARLALPDDKANFKSALKDFAAGILNRRVSITVTSETPPVLRNLKLKNGTRIGNRRITIPYSVIEKAIGERASTTTKEGHALRLEDLELLPDSLYQPVMVLESDKEGCVEIYTEIFDANNDPVLVALALDYGEMIQSKNKEYEIRVNSIRSIYGKEHHNTPVNRLKDGNGLYVDMKKADSWCRAAGVQFPGAGDIRISNPNITLVNENFKPQNENSSRFSIFGEEGVRRMENAVQLLENLSTAKQMTADGKDAKAIKLATGWELGGDGKWRMEMPDAVFTTRAKLPDGAEYDRTLWDVVNTTNGKLSEYVVADEIFEAYPELKDYHFQIVQMPPEVGGSFNSDTKTIYINQLGLTAALKMVDDAQARLSDKTLTAAERKSAQHDVYLCTEQIFSQIDETLVHEVQHAIQHIEGFATGSNVRHFIDNPEYDPKRLEKVTYYREKLEKAQKNLEKHPDLKKMADRYVELEDVLFSDDNVQVDEAAIDAEMDQIKAHFESLGKRELLMDYITGRDNYKMAKYAAEKYKLDPEEAYRRTAGEVEARNVQERRNYTMEERLNSLLSETEDVAEKDKIYLNGLVRGNSNSESGMRDAELEQTDIRKVQKLDHSQYQENTMLAETAEIPVVHVESKFKTLNETQEIIEDKIRKNNGSLKVMNTEQNMQISIQSHGSLDEAVSLKALDSTRTDGTMPEIHAAALLNIEKLLETARLGASHPDWHVHAKNFMRGEHKEKAVQIHRFYAAMEYEKNIYGVKMTAREKWNGKTVFYTLEAHDLEIQKINPAVENNRGGVAKAASPVQSPGIQFSMFFEKFKPIVDLLGLKYKEDYPFVRFSVAPDDAFVQAWAKVLLPVVSTQYINVDGAAAYLMDHGIEVYAGRDDDTLRKACVLAQTWKKERNKVVRGNREHKALEKKDPYYKILSEKYGRDFKINAGPKYDGTVFTGTWMDKHKTEKGRSGSITAAEAAKILTESTGKEVTEAVVVEHFGHLKRETLLQEYREKRRKKNELWEIEQELLEEERQQTTGDIPLGDVPMPQETQAMEEARKRFVKGGPWGVCCLTVLTVPETCAVLPASGSGVRRSRPVVPPSQRPVGNTVPVLR